MSVNLSRSTLTGRWRALTDAFFESAQGRRLGECLAQCSDPVFPSTPFRAQALTPFEAVKVVIVGQDPYHGAGQAQGLAFSVAPGVRVPPSLRNIYKELAAEYGSCHRTDGDLSDWARQGVLLMNAVLTVSEGRPGSHRRFGWETLTELWLAALSKEREGLVFMLWGDYAQRKRPLIDEARHLVLACNHPSPLSAMRGPTPFMGCGHFKAADRHLEQRGMTPVQWCKCREEIAQPELFNESS